MKVLFYILLSLICGNLYANTLGSNDRPIKIALVPGQDVKKLMLNGRVLEEYLEQKLKKRFEVVVPQSFVAVVESMGTERVDMAIMNSFGYILAHDKYQARARLMGMFKNRAEYWGQIIARHDGPKTIDDLNGKTFAFVDPASTSGFLLAKKALNDHKIKLKEHVFAGKHDSVVSMVYQGRVEAGATYHTLPDNGVPQDARKLVATQYPDVWEKVKILKITGPIPNDPVVFRKDFPKDIEDQIILSMKDFIKTPKGQEAMMNLYHMDDLKDAKDNEWDALRKILKDIHMTPNDFIKK
jgi:phosphonate transport system substrate-binding protein